MKKTIVYFCLASSALIVPIQLITIILMLTMGMDTIVKLISLRTVAKNEGKAYRDVFKSKILRKGYFLKILGYMVLALPLLPLDIYFLTPFVIHTVQLLGYNIATALTPALFTNGLLIIFCLVELSSINENWFDFSGYNILASVFNMVKKLKQFILNASSFYKEVKNDNQ